MTEPVIVCLAPHIREMIEEATGVGLSLIPACKGTALFETKEIKGAGRGGKKRAPSEYNRFIGTCMKSGESMRSCASEWKKKE